MTKQTPIFKMIIVTLLSVLPVITFAQTPLGNTMRAHLKVEGMISNACPIILRSAARKIDGVKFVAANLADHSAIIDYDPTTTTLADVQQHILNKTGFNTKLIE